MENQKQACSQELRDPQKVDLLDQKSGLFEPHPPQPFYNTKTPFLAHFLAKSGSFGIFGVAPPAPPLAMGLIRSIANQEHGAHNIIPIAGLHSLV